MCDYSLGGIKNRLAKEGEDLVIHQFSTGSKGLTSSQYLQPKSPILVKGIFNLNAALQAIPKECAVCIPDGAKLQIHDGEKCHSGEVVTFRQLTSKPHQYRDGIQFSNGEAILLQDIPTDLKMKVLSLCPQESEAFSSVEDLSIVPS